MYAIFQIFLSLLQFSTELCDNAQRFEFPRVGEMKMVLLDADLTRTPGPLDLDLKVTGSQIPRPFEMERVSSLSRRPMVFGP